MTSDTRRIIYGDPEIPACDIWADVPMYHLSPSARREATEARNTIMEQQQGRTLMRAPYETGETEVRTCVIDTLLELNKFLENTLKLADEKPTVITLETKGTSNCWVKARKELDGDDYYKNDESSGVTVITMCIIDHEGEKVVAFIDVKTIIEDELDGKPTLPDKFFKLLSHPKVMLIGESIVKHLKRIENCFFVRMSRVLYLTLNDLTRRWRHHKHDVGNTWEFKLKPNENDGLLLNFHEVFRKKSFFKNPYEVLSDWSDVRDLRDSQVKHALNKSWFSALLIEKILEYFWIWKLSLSVMGTLYPRCKDEDRVDFRNQDFKDFGVIPPHWYREEKWPCCPVERFGSCSRENGLGEPDRVRLEQEEGEKQRRSHLRRDHKRKHVVSDVSDNEDADQAHIKRRIENNKAQRHGSKVARHLRVDHSIPNIQNLMRPNTESDEVLFVSTVISELGELKSRRPAKDILSHYANSWPNDRKEKLVSKLAHDGYFRNVPDKSLTSSAFQAMSLLNINRPTTNFLLQMDVQHSHLASYISRLYESKQRDVLDGLEEYLGLPLDDRKLRLESCDFYNRRDLMRYVKEDVQIETLIKSICLACDTAPGDAFFRNRRPTFINSVIDSGRQGLVSSVNAARIIEAHVGESIDDRWDAVVMSARWPAVARSLHAHWKLWGPIPQIRHCEPNLKKDMSCRRGFHYDQTDKEVTIMKTRTDVANLKTAFLNEDLVVLIFKPNRDPRSFSILPSFIAFRAPGREIYGFFPHDGDATVRDEILSFLSTKILFVRAPELVRKWLTPDKKKFRYVHAATLAESVGEGRSSDAIANFVWGYRFCVVTCDEWFCDPISPSQEYHTAYLLNLLDSLIGKIGLSTVMDRIHEPK